jgi:general secretion pathway protein G
MKHSFKRNLQKGFTLVELLIVVIILAILAAIVVPQFSSSTTDAKIAAAASNLSAIRSSIELYRAQHTAYPGLNASSGGTGSCSSKGTGTAGTAQALIDQLTLPTDSTGAACAVADTTNYKYGPYIRGTGLMNEPFSNKGGVVGEIVVTSAGSKPTAGTAGGYAYDAKSGDILINNTASDGGTPSKTQDKY